jgi:hypothetical protein
MLSRLAARLLTGPVAFLVAGVIDIAAFVLLSLLHRARQRLRWRRRHSAIEERG